MITYISLHKLVEGVSHEDLESMIRLTKTTLLKIPEVLAVRCGREVSSSIKASKWPFFYMVEAESRHKLKILLDDPIYLKFRSEVIKKSTSSSLSLSYELDPSRINKP